MRKKRITPNSQLSLFDLLDDIWVYRRCITLRNGKRICKPKGQAFKFKDRWKNK